MLETLKFNFAKFHQPQISSDDMNPFKLLKGDLLL